MLLFANVIIPLKRILISFSVHGSFSWRPVQDHDMSTENLVRKKKEETDLHVCFVITYRQRKSAKTEHQCAANKL